MLGILLIIGPKAAGTKVVHGSALFHAGDAKVDSSKGEMLGILLIIGPKAWRSGNIRTYLMLEMSKIAHGSKGEMLGILLIIGPKAINIC